MMENKELKKPIPVELGDEILKKVSAGLTEEELLRIWEKVSAGLTEEEMRSIFESEEARRSELLNLRNECLRSQMDAAQEAYEAHRSVAEKDFAAGLSFSLPGIE